MKRFVRWLAGTPERRLALALVCLCAVVYIPLAGNYGMWDPWESHYGEVARQMAMRNDWISLWWPGSPQDRMEFFSKPALTEWLMALSMKLFGLEWGHPAADEMVRNWRPEWACRLPNILLTLAVLLVAAKERSCEFKASSRPSFIISRTSPDPSTSMRFPPLR